MEPAEEAIGRNIEKLCRRARNYTALFCCSDIYATIMMSALKERGLRVPEDISIIGFDDNLFSKVCTPRLTTVHQDADEKGRVAAQTLVGMITGKAPASKKIRLETRLVIRDSVRKIE